MKVLLLTHIYPSLAQPTRGPYNHSIFQAVARRSEAHVIVPEPWWNRVRHPQDLFSAPRESQTGIEATFPTYWSVPRMTSLHARGMYLSLRSRLRRLRTEFPFDVIFASWAYPDAAAAAMLARDFDCPLIVKILGSDINSLARIPALREQIRAGLERAYRVVTVSEALKERVVELGISPEKVLVCHNGVDGERFAIRDREAAIPQFRRSLDRPLICYVGRLSHEKGIDVMLEAMRVLKDQGRRDIDLALVGGGDLEQPMRARAHALGIAEQVRFIGTRPHAEIPGWISACDVLCLPSRREGCPNVVLEALASGRPVVASRVGGVPEILSAENGELVPSEDAEALARGLQTALQREWDPQRLRASVKALSWDEVGAKYYTVLCDAVAAHKSGHARGAFR